MSREGDPPLVEVECREGVAIVRFPSKMFQRAETEALQGKMEELFLRGVTTFIFDLGDCLYISSEGLGTTARYWKFCRDRHKGRMAVVMGEETDPEVQNLFEIIGLAAVIGSAVRPTVDDALKYLKTFS